MSGALLEAVAAALVPAAAGLPGAADAGAAAGVEAVLGACPRLREPLREALAELAPAAAPGAGAAGLEAAVARLEREQPERFAALLEAVAAAWALSPAVWAALGYEGQRDLDPAAYGDGEELLAPVLERGPLWRDPEPTTTTEEER